MTGNKFHGETCAYCTTATSTTDDHVFARKFMLEGRREGIPQVPACGACNSEKSKLESELMVVLGFAGRHADALENLSTEVAHRLENRANAKIARTIRGGMGKALAVESGVMRPALTVPVDWTKVERLCAYVARGLAWHNFDKLLLGAETSVMVTSLVGAPAAKIRRFRMGKTQHVVEGDIGAGSFSYWGAQAHDNPAVTAWEFSIYAGIRTVDSGDGPLNIFVMTGPRRIADAAERQHELLGRWREGTRLNG